MEYFFVYLPVWKYNRTFPIHISGAGFIKFPTIPIKDKFVTGTQARTLQRFDQNINKHVVLNTLQIKLQRQHFPASHASSQGLHDTGYLLIFVLSLLNMSGNLKVIIRDSSAWGVVNNVQRTMHFPRE